MYLMRPYLYKVRQKTNPMFSEAQWLQISRQHPNFVFLHIAILTDHLSSWSLPLHQKTQLRETTLGQSLLRLDVGFCGRMEPIINLRIETFTSIDSDELITTHLQASILALLVFKSIPGQNCLSNRTFSTKVTREKTH